MKYCFYDKNILRFDWEAKHLIQHTLLGRKFSDIIDNFGKHRQQFISERERESVCYLSFINEIVPLKLELYTGTVLEQSLVQKFCQ